MEEKFTLASTNSDCRRFGARAEEEALVEGHVAKRVPPDLS